jgi:hypothetical protein
VGERSRDQAADVHLPDPVSSLPCEQGVAFDEVQCMLHGSLVRSFDLRSEVRVGDRPQRRHRLHRGKRQVIAGNRLGARTRLSNDCRRNLAGIDRVPAMLASEKLPRHLGAHVRPICRRDRPVGQLSCWPVPRGNPLRHLDPERADLAGVNLERRAQPGRSPRTFLSVKSPASSCSNRVAARGCRPAPNKARICSAVTGALALRPSIPTMPDPIHAPGLSPRSV